MFTLPLSLLLLACSGGETDAVDPADGTVPEPVAVEPDAPEGVAIGGITCEAGTNPQEATTDKGREFWCDRGGVMHGPFLRLHSDDTKATEGAYSDNLPDGNWIWWHPNGTEASKGKYVKGKQTGSWTSWYEEGTRKDEGDYLQGRKQGTWTGWHATGMKSEEGIYHNGMKNALWTYFDDSEENFPVRTELWKNGQLAEEKEVPPPKK
jgi:antitoxin component YwqK of YwqJK toxin-antitoxin module